jgi:hypothetical protein
METTEKIVESYVRYVKGWATIPNIRCDGQQEIDLLAIDPASGHRYHIEVSVSISSGFSKITGKSYDAERAKVRVEQAGQRTTLGHFREKKFAAPVVTKKLAEFGFRPGEYGQIIVAWDWTDEAEQQAEAAGIVMWRISDLMRDISEQARSGRSYFTDDTLRTLHLYAMSMKKG